MPQKVGVLRVKYTRSFDFILSRDHVEDDYISRRLLTDYQLDLVRLGLNWLSANRRDATTLTVHDRLIIFNPI